MGYEQYWLAAPELPQREWDMAVKDFAKVAAALHRMGLRLAGPDGRGRPTINGETIAFNGVLRCGHGPPRPRTGVVAWPAEDAAGIAPEAVAGARGRTARRGRGTGSGGGAVPRRAHPLRIPLIAHASARACDGSCAAGQFVLSRTIPDDEYTKVYGSKSPVSINGVHSDVPRAWVGKYFGKCRTLYKPYDLAVCCALLVAKRRFGSLMVVASDGTNRNWADVRAVCQQVLGYGQTMKFGAGGRMLCAAGTRTPAAPDMSGRHVPVFSPDGDSMDFEAIGQYDGGVIFSASYGGGGDGDDGGDGAGAAGNFTIKPSNKPYGAGDYAASGNSSGNSSSSSGNSGSGGRSGKTRGARRP